MAKQCDAIGREYSGQVAKEGSGQLGPPHTHIFMAAMAGMLADAPDPQLEEIIKAMRAKPRSWLAAACPYFVAKECKGGRGKASIHHGKGKHRVEFYLDPLHQWDLDITFFKKKVPAQAGHLFHLVCQFVENRADTEWVAAPKRMCAV